MTQRPRRVPRQDHVPAGECWRPVAGGGTIDSTSRRQDLATSTRFADPLTARIANTDLMVFEDCSPAPIYENVEDFNRRTLEFLKRYSG
jgi:hypothetical protein